MCECDAVVVVVVRLYLPRSLISRINILRAPWRVLLLLLVCILRDLCHHTLPSCDHHGRVLLNCCSVYTGICDITHYHTDVTWRDVVSARFSVTSRMSWAVCLCLPWIALIPLGVQCTVYSRGKVALTSADNSNFSRINANIQKTTLSHCYVSCKVYSYE